MTDESTRHRIEAEGSSKLVREILEAMCRKQGLAIISEFDPSTSAANYVLAQRLGIGSVFGIPDHEEHKTEVAFSGGPWNRQTFKVDQVVAPVFAVGHEIGNHYWLDTKGSGTPTYYWDDTEWAYADNGGDGSKET